MMHVSHSTYIFYLQNSGRIRIRKYVSSFLTFGYGINKNHYDAAEDVSICIDER